MLTFFFFFFFFNDTATTEIYTLSALFPYTTLFRSRRPSATRTPSSPACVCRWSSPSSPWRRRSEEHTSELQSPLNISYAVFCLKKKKKKKRKKNKRNTKKKKTTKNTTIKN